MNSTIFDLIIKGGGVSNTPPSPDPLHEEDVFVEATLLSMLTTMLNDSVALLFDLRTSLFLNQGNTGVLIARKVSELSVSDFAYLSKNFYVWVSGISKIEVANEVCSINIDNQIHIRCRSVDFFIGIVEGIGEVAQSLDDGLDAYLKTTPHWNSEFVVTSSSHIPRSLLKV